MKTIEARAIISAEDRASKVFDDIARKIDQIGKSAKTGKAIDQMAAAIERAKTQMAAIDRFNEARGGFAAARERFRSTQLAVEAAARAMSAGAGPAGELRSAYDRAARAVSAASKAFEQQQAAVLSSKRALEGIGIGINEAATHQARLRTAIERTNAALAKQPRALARAAGAAARGSGVVLPFAGPAILHGTKAAAKAGAEIESEVVKQRAAGIPEDDIQRAAAASVELAKKYPTVKRSTALERFRELRSVLLHPEEAHELLPTTVQANAAMNAIDRTGHLAEGLQFAIKGAEVMGLAQDPARFRDYMNSFIKAQQVMGKTITPESQYEFAKYLKASAPALSDRFKMTTGVSLSQEMGGSTTGVSIDQFVKQVIGGFQGAQHAAAKSFVALGLAKKDDFELTKTGEIKGFKPGRHVAGHKLAQTDPDQWVYQYYLPALRKKGITSQEDVLAQVRRDFPSGRAADVVSKMITQRESFENHARLYDKAQGLDATITNRGDPFVALNSLTTSIQNFAATLTSPAMQSAASAMSGFAEGVGGLGEALAAFQKQHPDASKLIAGGTLAAGAVGGGVLTFGLLSSLASGFGLSGSAAALDGSAAALTAAAAELSAAAGGKAAAETAAKGVAGAGVWGSLALGGIASGVAAGGTAASWYALNQYKQNPEAAQATIDNPMLGAMDPSGAFAAGILYGGQPRGVPPAWAEKMGLVGTGAPTGGAFGDHQSGPVVAQLQGSAEVKGEATVKVEVSASSELLRVYEGMKTTAAQLEGRLNANGPGSAGRSSPDAASAGAGMRGP